MEHINVLNMLLANACGTLTDDELKGNGGWQVYHIELHCASATVIARHLGDLKFEVLKCEMM